MHRHCGYYMKNYNLFCNKSPQQKVLSFLTTISGFIPQYEVIKKNVLVYYKEYIGRFYCFWTKFFEEINFSVQNICIL